MIGVATPPTWNFGSNWPRWSEIADFWSIFAGSTSSVTPSKKVHLTLIGSPLRALQWAQDEHRTLSLSPLRVAQKHSVQIWTISYDNSETVRDTMSVTLITNRKSHIGFQLILTLNNLEWHNSPYFAFFTELNSFASPLCRSGYTPIMSVKYCSSSSLHFWP